VKKNEKLQAATAIALVIFIQPYMSLFSPLSDAFSPQKKREGKLFGLFSFSECPVGCYTNDYCRYNGCYDG
jgi:hypothetical protein